jgi:hypothetical protein
MTWVAWRQQRAQILLSFALVALLAALVIALRIDASSIPADDLAQLSDRYNGILGYLAMFLLLVPVLLGMFAGAPVFAREIEQGTHIFGLTQSIGRTRWWATKLVVAGLPVTVAMTVLGLVNAWALAPLNFMMSGRMRTPLFESQGLVLGAYTVAAFAIGATAGLLVRNTLAAMAITLGGYAAALVVLSNAARPAYADPLLTTGPAPYGAWRVGGEYLDAQGNAVAFSPNRCDGESFRDCMTQNGVFGQSTLYQPDERFWNFQAIEGGLFLVIAAAVLALGAWALRHRLH